jgi:GDPmannose 4,6-dehydratase
MKAIIFGASGQDGYYLTKLLEKLNIDVLPISRKQSLQYITGDIADKKFVDEIIKKNQPEYIFNFAAISKTSYDVLIENHETITTGSINVLDAVLKYSPKTKIFLSGSALQFENNNLPIDEKSTFVANNGYSAARIYTTYLSRYYRTLGLNVYVGYFFNHDSPLRETKHISQYIVSTVKKILNGEKEKIVIGNPNVMKEWTFAGDIVNAVWVLVNQDKVFECVIGSGNAYKIEYWIQLCLAHAKLNWDDHVEINNQFKTDYDILVSNPKIIKSLGWEPIVSIEELCVLMFSNESKN